MSKDKIENIYDECLETVRDYLAGVIDFKALEDYTSTLYQDLNLFDMKLKEIKDNDMLQTLISISIAINDFRYAINCKTTEYYDEDDLILLLRSFVQIY